MAIKNGKVYQAKTAGHQVLVRGEIKKWNHDGTVIIGSTPELTAEFGTFGAERPFTDAATGISDVGAEIRGHFFDSAAQAEEKGWTQDEHDVVIKVLDRSCETHPEYMWLYSAPRVAAPWPTYDLTHHKSIPTLAEQLGLVGEALQYETQEKNRAEIVERLSSLLAEQQTAGVAEEELTAA